MRRDNKRDLRPQLGQLLWIGLPGCALLPPVARLLRQVRPGAVILFGRNIEDAHQLRELTDALYRCIPIPPFIAIDQEGGRVNRLRDIVGPSPSNHDLANRPHPPVAVRRHAEATVLALRSLGFNVNFTPVLDLSGPRHPNGIGDRSFGEEPGPIASLAAHVVRIHLRAGLVPVGKHFPGLGGARLDTHLALPVIRRTRRQLLRREILPYRKLRSSLPIVMVGHACYPALQGGRTVPASLSPAVVGLLRSGLGFRGMVLTDDLEMGALDQSADGGEQALAAYRAGHDGLMFCRSEQRIAEAHEALLRALERGDIDAADLRTRLHRIARLKRRFLLSRRRSRHSTGSLARARLLFESLGPASPDGVDPTARV